MVVEVYTRDCIYFSDFFLHKNTFKFDILLKLQKFEIQFPVFTLSRIETQFLVYILPNATFIHILKTIAICAFIFGHGGGTLV
jgi:hypothetical protein